MSKLSSANYFKLKLANKIEVKCLTGIIQDSETILQKILGICPFTKYSSGKLGKTEEKIRLGVH